MHVWNSRTGARHVETGVGRGGDRVNGGVGGWMVEGGGCLKELCSDHQQLSE